MSAQPLAAPAAPRRAAGALRRPPAWTLAALLAVVYLIIAPQSPDLAAASYRSHLFSELGFTLWDNSWYAGHHLPAYSLLAPALGAAIGPALLAALSMVAATALFEVAIDGRFPPRAARAGAFFFAAGAGIALLSSRVPFDLGLALGLGAIVLAQRGRWGIALALAVLSSLASPVAGAFLALAALTWALCGPPRARPAALMIAALAPIALLALLFPEGGTQPFVGSAFWPALAGVAVIGLALPREERLLRVGALLYALVLIGCYLVPSAVGGNADRLGALAAGPLAVCALLDATPRWRHVLALVLVAPLFYWQVNAPVADFASTLSNPATSASYYEPLLAELRALGIGYGRRPARIEVVPTVDHWEARYVAHATMIARGWERQLDRYRNALFYEERPGTPSAARYRAWLSEQAVSYVALPDAPLDYSGKGEAALLRRPSVTGAGGFLREVWQLAPLAPVRGRRRDTARATAGAVDRARHAVLHAGRAGGRLLPRAAALHAVLGARARARLRLGNAGRMDESEHARARRGARGDLVRARARLRTRAALPVSHRLGCSPMLVRARLLQERVLPHGWLDALRQVSLFAACLPRLPLRARPGRGRGQRGLRARARPDLARAQRCTSSSSPRSRPGRRAATC